MSIAVSCLLALSLSTPATGSIPARNGEEARWLRYAAISPDGAHVAFSYAGDIWVAPVTGAGETEPVEARLLTTHVGYETRPVWAPDSRTIAFAADWFGQLDVFLTTIDRAPATRLTFHSASDVPTSFSADGRELWFTSSRQDAVEARLGSAVLSELYAIDIGGGAPRRLLTTPAELARPNADGSIVLYQDLKAYEDPWRKHQVSSHARDLWKWTPATGEHVQLTSFRGEDRDPVWIGDAMAFLSERGGSFNVWVAPLDRMQDARPVTRHEVHPVRFLSAADDGTLAYTYDGEIWVLKPGEATRRLPVVARVDQRTNPLERETFRDGVTEMAVSPDEDEVAFVARGEVFVASIEHGTTRRVTETPEQERSVTWAKDGRTLYYASERDGSWNLYASSIRREEEEDFSAATLLSEEVLLADEHETFQPLASPDGKHLAFLVDRDAIHVMDLETKQHRAVVPANWNYSYEDGDISYAWSPDSRWLTFTYSPYERYTGDVGIVSIDGGDAAQGDELVNASRSGYDEGAPRFTPDGKAVVYASGRFGQREHSGRGGQADVLAVYLTQAAYDEAALSWEELERVEQKRKEEEKEKKKAEKEKAKQEGEDDAGEDDAEDDEKAVEPIEVELDRMDERRRRLTMQSAPTGDLVVTPNGEAVIYMAEVDGKWDLWTSHLRDKKTQRLLELGDESPGAALHLSKDGKTLVIRTAKGQLKKAKLTLGEHDLPEGRCTA